LLLSREDCLLVTSRILTVANCFVAPACIGIADQKRRHLLLVCGFPHLSGARLLPFLTQYRCQCRYQANPLAQSSSVPLLLIFTVLREFFWTTHVIHSLNSRETHIHPPSLRTPPPHFPPFLTSLKRRKYTIIDQNRTAHQ
jgi:hypothetical protein